MADFLISLFDEGLALATIRSHRSAIGAVHRGFSDGSSVSSSEFISRIVQACFRQRPPARRLVPAWDLPCVLQALARPPFEPMAGASLKLVSVKTAFLLAVASGQRRSALHALSLAPGHVRWERGGVRLVPAPGFIAKNQLASSAPVEIFLPSIASASSVRDDRLWCPVRALKYYIDRTKLVRTTPALFIGSVRPHLPVSLATISRWLVEAIRAAGEEALAQPAVRAHDTRAIAASWALFNGASVEDIQKAAYWSSANTFISCYLRDVVASRPAFAEAVLAAGSA